MEKVYRLQMTWLTVVGPPIDGKIPCALGGMRIGAIPSERLEMRDGNNAVLKNPVFRIVGAEQDGMTPCELIGDNTPLRIPTDELVEFKAGPEPMIEGC
jgi:hypothetical protein